MPKFIYDYYRIYIPRDIFLDDPEALEFAIDEARSMTRLWTNFAEWSARFEEPDSFYVIVRRKRPSNTRLIRESQAYSFTDPRYWDCECEQDYIKPKSIDRCAQCGAHQDDMPDSMTEEVKRSNSHA